ncbi:MAG: antitoxin Xre/MbcA/ParS toxin-binding domain-containing protein [Pseudomonas sp.]|uniref:antitoxin Xre/MbcA/ParS toxin-binding domain-containing protein n=1 Tax=Pseudomonas sp. TaxID=306 RepID=UPI003D6ECDC5
MFAEVMREDTYRAYRIRLETLLQIPTDALDKDIHELIEAGFSASSVDALCTMGTISPSARNLIIPLKTLKSRLARGQQLTLSESDRLFRVTHVTAMAEALFGNDAKAKRWLLKPKERFSGSCPIAMLSTFPGTRAVEKLLLEIAEGYSF